MDFGFGDGVDTSLLVEEPFQPPSTVAVNLGDVPGGLYPGGRSMKTTLGSYDFFSGLVFIFGGTTTSFFFRGGCLLKEPPFAGDDPHFRPLPGPPPCDEPFP